MKKPVLSVHILFALFWLLSCEHTASTENASQGPTPPSLLSWNTDPNSRIVLATFCCDGPIIEELVHPYILEAQVWGDGRFLWNVQDDNGARQVFTKQLSTDEMNRLMKEIATSGFFDWDEHYEGEPAIDAASQCLAVILHDQDKTVCATHV